MKTTANYDPNATTWILFIIMTFLAGLITGRANAQRSFFVPQDVYIGFETITGNRTFHINSDLPNLQGMNALQRGQTYGVNIGNKLVSGKLRLGSFTTATSDIAPVKSHTFEMGSNFNPLQLIKSKTRFFEPYLSTSIEVSTIKSNGTYIPPAAPVSTSSTCTCQCQSSTSVSSLPANPDQPAANTPAPSNPVSYSGKIGTTRLNMGMGMKIHIPRGRHYLNFFTEMKYGMPIGNTASTQALLNTKALNQISFDFGLAVGLIYNKSNSHLKRVRFR